MYKLRMWSNSSSPSFLLTGFPGLEATHHWISIFFFFIYISVLFGNGTLLLLIKEDHSLHEPMYFFLAMLAATDLGMTLTTMPTVLGVLWLDHREIGSAACFSQAYFIHSLSFVESGVLLIMAYDRFIAICNPLRYTCILTNTRIMKIGLAVLMRGFVSVVPPIMPLYFFPYCHSHLLSHAFCLHQDVIKLACADTTFNRLYPVVLVVFIFVLDSLIILISYVLILKTVLSVASREGRAKAFNTCVSHICCVLVFFVTVIGLSLIHRFGKQVPHIVHLTVSYVYFLFPPLMNPIIYSVKTKQIRNGILHRFTTRRTGT
ncbi:olfactory receptor 51B5 [Sapajus apella]|uniref:Olfactory receptor n=1 Tax=Sapajus apella TaxID=9515 RepID=A0A6J3EWD0_SAPAP|nr:olfactory receptor 51B5 [Sapajus apella]